MIDQDSRRSVDGRIMADSVGRKVFGYPFQEVNALGIDIRLRVYNNNQNAQLFAIISPIPP
jgi:hypothetical protein